MNTSKFWALIDQSRQAADGDPDLQLEELLTLLETLAADDIAEFQRLFVERFQASYTWPLWGAAYVIGGGCSDDGFDYFRGWLISRGEEIFTAAMADPDRLASLVQEIDEEVDCQVEGWQSVAVEAWCRTTGRASSAFPFIPTSPHLDGPAGDAWSEEDLDRLYPLLSMRFG